jgi:predicted ATPase
MRYEGNPQELLCKLMEPQPEVVAVTGGPAAGKTMVLDAIAAKAAEHDRPIRIVPEVPTMWMAEHGVNLGELAQIDRGAYVKAQIEISRTKGELQEQALQELAGTNGIVITDRGRADDGAYMTADEFAYVAAELGTTPVQLVHEHADKVVFLRSLAVNYPEVYEEVCGNNGTRYEGINEARATDWRTLMQWKNHPELHVIDGADRKQKIRDAAGFILSGETELERRWEVDSRAAEQYTSIDLGLGTTLNIMQCYQTYHRLGGVDYRLRHGVGSDRYDFYHFAIKEATANGNTELRRRLTRDEYSSLITGILEGALSKDRYVVLDGPQIWHGDKLWDPKRDAMRWFFEAEVPTPESFGSLVMPLADMYQSDYNTRRFAHDNVTMFA